MPLALSSIAILTLAIWLYLAFARGSFWRLRPFDDDLAQHQPPSNWPKVVAIVPARNEAPTIAQSVRSLLQQNYPGEFSVVVVDDHSNDTTAQLAQQAANELNAASRFALLRAAALEPGWTGKLWALHCGTAISGCPSTTSIAAPATNESRTEIDSSANNSTPPTYFWFTDADIVHAPDTLSRLVSRAERYHLDLTSLMVLLQAKTFPERLLIPPFLYFFLKLYPPRWITNPRHRTAGAAGGCILLRREALGRIGGLPTIRNEVIDDCALARAIKRSSGRLWLGLTRASISLRPYNSFAEIRDMIARTAFTQLSYSPLLLLGTLLGLSLTYIAPIALLFAHPPEHRILALWSWTLMTLLFVPTVRFYRLNPLWALTLPAAAAFYAYATLLSAARYYAGRGAHWKGRSQPPQFFD